MSGAGLALLGGIVNSFYLAMGCGYYAMLVTWNLPGLPSRPQYQGHRHSQSHSVYREDFIRHTRHGYNYKWIIIDEARFQPLFYNSKPLKASCDSLLPVASNNRQGRAVQWQVGRKWNQSWGPNHHLHLSTNITQNITSTTQIFLNIQTFLCLVTTL